MIICGYSRVKDEADIIESFCRYHLTFLDAMAIWDDCSSDRTVEIIQSLIDEGLPIDLIHLDKNEQILNDYDLNEINQMHKRCLYIFDRHSADWVVPLDADEFLFCEDGTNPRLRLEKLDEHVEHLFPWRTGIFCCDPVDSNIFLPNYFKEYRDPSLECLKVIISRSLAQEGGAFLGPGKHRLLFHSVVKTGYRPPVIKHTQLALAHFPIRSLGHALSKVICWQMRNLSVDGTKPFHYQRIYDDIILDGNNISVEKIRQFSLEYSLTPEQISKSIKTISQPYGVLRADFLQDELRLLYTDYNDRNYLRMIIIFIEQLVLKLKNDAVHMKNENEHLKAENEHLKTETTKILQEMNKVVEDLCQANHDLTEQVNTLSHPDQSAELK